MRVSHRPENSIVGAARLQRDAVSNLVADVYVHLVCNTEGQINSLPSLDLTAHHHTVLVLRRQTQLCTPLRDLKTWTHTISTWTHSTTTLHKPSGNKKNVYQIWQLFQYPVDSFLCRWSILRPILDLFNSCMFRPTASAEDWQVGWTEQMQGFLFPLNTQCTCIRTFTKCKL